MKKFILMLIALTACMLSSAMENQHQADQDEPIRHYTLAHLQNQQGNQGAFQQPDRSNINPAHLAFFGLQQGDSFTANQLSDRYHDRLHLLTPGQVSERYRAFSALYPYAQHDQQEVQQQAEATFFNPSNYDYHSYYSPEFFRQSDVRETETNESNYLESLRDSLQAMEVDDAMETDGPDYLRAISDSYDINRGIDLFANVTPHLPHDAIVTVEDLEKRSNQLRETIYNHLIPYHDNLLPLNRWFLDSSRPVELIVNAQQQTSETVQSSSDNPDEQIIIGGYDTTQESDTWLIPVMMFTRSSNGSLIQSNARYRYFHRRRRINRHPNPAHNNDNNQNHNDGSGATGTGN